MDYSFPNDYYPAETPNTVAEKYKGLEIALPYPYPPSPTITPGIDLLPYNNSYLLENIDDFFVGGGGSMLQQYLHIPSTNSRDWSIIQSPTPILSLSPLEWLQNISVDLDNYGIPSPRGVVTSNKATSKRKAVAVKKTRVSSSSSTSSLPGQAHYPCHECDSVFTSRKNLNSHSIRHTDGKPFQCGICSDSLKRKGDLLRHVRIVHGRQSRLPCMLCRSSTSTDLISLKLHLDTVHQGEPSAKSLSALITASIGFKKKEIVMI